MKRRGKLGRSAVCRCLLSDQEQREFWNVKLLVVAVGDGDGEAGWGVVGLKVGRMRGEGRS